MAILFALLAAGVYGVSDFLGGLASRGTRALTVLLYNYPGGAVVMIGLLPLFPGPLTGATIGWGAAGGVAGEAGVFLLYSALARAPMNVVSPITAVLSAAVPVIVGVGTGERPKLLAWVGIALGMIAVVLIARTPQHSAHAALDRVAILMALGSGTGFGVYFVCLAHSPSNSGLWPVVIARVTAAAICVPLAARTGSMIRLEGRLLLLALGSGVLDAGANLFFLLASRHGYLSIAGVITALYPAGTVLLAVGLLKERTGVVQRYGLALAVGAVVLIAR